MAYNQNSPFWWEQINPQQPMVVRPDLLRQPEAPTMPAWLQMKEKPRDPASDTEIGALLNLEGGGAPQAQPYTKTVTQTNTPIFQSPEEFQAQYDMMRQSPQFQAQRDRVSKLADLLGAQANIRAESQQVDYSPLLALVDSMYGSNLRGGYTKPESPETVAARGVGAQKEIMSQERQLQKDILAAMEGRKRGTTQTTVSRESGKKPSASGASAAIGKAPQLFSAFQQDIRKNKEALQQAENAIGVLRTKNPVGDAAVQTLMARASGEVGNLSAQEQARFAGDPSLWNQFSRLFGKYNSGEPLTEKDRGALIQLAKKYKEYQQRVIASRGEYFAESVAPLYGVPTDRARTALMPKIEAFATKEANKNSGGLTPEEEKELKALEAKYGK